MVTVDLKKLFKMPDVLKLPELVLGFIILLMSRVGGSVKIPNGPDYFSIPWGDDTDGEIFGSMVCYGYFFILLIQIIGIVTGDKTPIGSTLFALFGFIFWVAIGALRIDHINGNEILSIKGHNRDTALAMASLAIINGCIYAAEGVLHALNLRKD